jgi:regulator of replication initiation timing
MELQSAATDPNVLPWLTFGITQALTIMGISFKFGMISERLAHMREENKELRMEVMTLRDAFNYSKGREDAMRELARSEGNQR